MRIAFLGDAQSSHTLRWIRSFVQTGHEVSLLSLQTLPTPEPGVRFEQILTSPQSQGFRRLLDIRRQVRRALANLRPEIVHAHYIAGYGHMAWLSGFHPCVLTAWGSDLYQDASRSLTSRLLTRLALRGAALVTADSHDLARQAVRLGARPGRTHLIQFGVDTGFFSPNLPAAGLGARLGIGESARVILSPRGLQPLYNVDQIVRAFALIHKKYPDTLLIVKDLNGDPLYRQAIVDLIAGLQLQPAVRLIGAQDYADLPLLHNLAEVEVSIPSTDGTPVTVLEAMACGRLIVACDVPSLREWITPGENGWLVDPADPENIAAAVCAALDTAPPDRLRMQAANLQIVSSRASHTENMRKMDGLYRALLHQTGAEMEARR